ncbi:carboxylesterase/lipase family protein [Streptomyces sp. NPDC088116]|uniref:carboxylesterase/lipase family protein n=1 Tax=Streptomyces sp. NPDC088116 TaxID=3365825 RepID=UPI0038078DCF
MTAADSARTDLLIPAGRLRGRSEGGVAVFRGIPYAQPPVGAMRFAAPRPVAAWDGVRDAGSFGPPCPQVGIYGEVPPPVEGPDADNWLTVNVWSPEPGPAARLPVMVWIHGGAYMAGTAGYPSYDGHRLAESGGVVVVTLNYRLGMEGFASIEGAPANRGLLDQIAALEWVRDNITAFGGDPGRVTVFGESAGAGSIAALLVMDRAAGLFSRAIMQSVPGTYFSAALADDIAAEITAGLGLRPTVADLAAIAPDRLAPAGDKVAATMAGYADRWGRVAHTSAPYSPVVDGDVLPTAPWQGLADGAARDIELIVGHNRDEYRLFTAMAGQLGKISEERSGTILNALGPESDGVRAYRSAYPDADAGLLHELVSSDWLFRMPTLRLAQAQAAAGGRVHLYELIWEAPAMGGVLGACHALDVPLVFGNLTGGLADMVIGENPPPEAEILSTEFRTAWTDFASGRAPGWPAYDAQRRLARVFGRETADVSYPEETSRRLWQAHHFAELPLLTSPDGSSTDSPSEERLSEDRLSGNSPLKDGPLPKEHRSAVTGGA